MNNFIIIIYLINNILKKFFRRTHDKTFTVTSTFEMEPIKEMTTSDFKTPYGIFVMTFYKDNLANCKNQYDTLFDIALETPAGIFANKFARSHGFNDIRYLFNSPEYLKMKYEEKKRMLLQKPTFSPTKPLSKKRVVFLHDPKHTDRENYKQQKNMLIYLITNEHPEKIIGRMPKEMTYIVKTMLDSIILNMNKTGKHRIITRQCTTTLDKPTWYSYINYLITLL